MKLHFILLFIFSIIFTLLWFLHSHFMQSFLLELCVQTNTVTVKLVCNVIFKYTLLISNALGRYNYVDNTIRILVYNILPKR